MKSLFPISLLLLACVFAPSLLLAQDTAQLTGIVSDPSGAAVANAQVVITNEGQGTSHTATSNGSGDICFRLCLSGNTI